MSDLWPIYEFRPLVVQPHWGPVYRYANGQWIEDDGEWDVAFYGHCHTYYVTMPYRPNILWSWTTQHWSGYESKHPGGNPWHYQLREGASDWGEGWARDRHMNEVYSRKAMEKCCATFGVANGGGPRFELNDPYMQQGLVRVVSTREIVTPPQEPVCMYCKLEWVSKRRREEGTAIQESRL